MKFYIVGGAIRDILLGATPKDVDFVAVGFTFDQMKRLFGPPVGREFPVFIGDLYGFKNVEIAMARTERSTGLGYRDFEVSFTPDITIEDDLYRRDLTINAIAIDMDTGRVVDPYGGRDDLKNGILRAVNSRAFVEDPIRILRIARFRARYNFIIEPETAALVKQNKTLLYAATQERIFKEMDKALSEPYAELFFETLDNLEVLPIIYPELCATDYYTIRGVNTNNYIKFGLIFVDKVDMYIQRFKNLPRSYKRIAKFIAKVKQTNTANIEDLYDVVVDTVKMGIDKELVVILNALNKPIHHRINKLINAVKNVKGDVVNIHENGPKFAETLKRLRIEAASK